MKQHTLAAGTVVKINGIPFRLTQDTIVEGHASNVIEPTYYVRHPDDSYSVAEPQPTRAQCAERS